MQFLEKFFKLKENKTSIPTEVLAGLTTFVTMVYILAVNPYLLGFALGDDMSQGGLFTATALMAITGTLIMGLYAKYPFALAPGMGLNAFFAFGVVPRLGGSWHTALFLLLIQGIMFVVLALFKFRERIFEAIPKNIKLSIGAGIGLFITHIGLQNAGFITAHGATLVELGDVTSVPVVLFMIGMVLTSFLVIKGVRGGLFIGILATYVVGLIAEFVGIYVPDYEAGTYSLIPSGFVSLPPSIADINLVTNFDQVSFAGIAPFAIISLILI